MLVWTQSIHGIYEKPVFSRLRELLSRMNPRGMVSLGLAPLFAVVVLGIYALRFDAQPGPVAVGIILVMTVVSRYFVIYLPTFSFDLEPVVMIGGLLVIGPFWTCVSLFAGVLWYVLFMERDIDKRNRQYMLTSLFNVEMTVIYSGITAMIYAAALPAFGSFCALLAAGIASPFINVGLVSFCQSAINRNRILENWRENQFSYICKVSIACAPVGYIMGTMFLVSPALVLLFLPPFVVLHFAVKSFFDIVHEVGVALQVIGDVLEERDEYTFGHTLRVADYSRAIAREMGVRSDEVENCVMVGRLHDIGKIAVSDDVLKKDGPLSKEEYREIQKHVSMIPELFPHMDRLGRLLHLAMYHHERFDGSGYPFGIKGEQIPIEARIVAVADAWDAMTSRRVYRDCLTEGQALKILREYAGKQWDPAVVDAFIKAYQKGLCRPSGKEAA